MEEENGTLLLAFDLAGVKILFPFYCFSLSYMLLVDVHGFDLMSNGSSARVECISGQLLFEAIV